MKDLFGDELTPDLPEAKSHYQKWKRKYRYRAQLGEDCLTARCGKCVYHRRIDYHNKIYHKCVNLGLSNSEATDIRVSYICDLYKEAKQ